MTEPTIFECSICFNQYNEISHRPLSLPCGHIYCERCLLKHSKGYEISCPIDSIVHKTSVRSLPCCYTILANLPRSPSKELCCTRHPRKKIKFHCISHSVFLCSDCIIQHTGNGHEIESFNPNTTAMKSELSRLDELFKTKCKEIEEIQKKAENQDFQLDSYYKGQIGKIRKAYDELIGVLTQKKREMIETMTKYFHDQKKLLDSYKYNINNTLETLLEGEKNINGMLENWGKFSCEEFYGLISTVKQKMSKCEAVKLPELNYYVFKNTLQASSYGVITKSTQEANKMPQNFNFDESLTKQKAFIPKLDFVNSMYSPREAVSPRNLYNQKINEPPLTQRQPEPTTKGEHLKGHKHGSHNNRGRRLPSQPPGKSSDKRWRKRSHSL
ncbi:unnamed protein product [Blepharisma stoltei]|uniref:RING-type domain-containing protein n=1 Tax=Blepharisma stoltei TaxID=1481888 RepID=A0AAU9JTU7_9CILI|nr:unnamed protein product [Blepharisma stoltei]